MKIDTLNTSKKIQQPLERTSKQKNKNKIYVRIALSTLAISGFAIAFHQYKTPDFILSKPSFKSLPNPGLVEPSIIKESVWRPTDILSVLSVIFCSLGLSGVIKRQKLKNPTPTPDSDSTSTSSSQVSSSAILETERLRRAKDYSRQAKACLRMDAYTILGISRTVFEAIETEAARDREIANTTINNNPYNNPNTTDIFYTAFTLAKKDLATEELRNSYPDRYLKRITVLDRNARIETEAAKPRTRTFSTPLLAHSGFSSHCRSNKPHFNYYEMLNIELKASTETMSEFFERVEIAHKHYLELDTQGVSGFRYHRQSRMEAFSYFKMLSNDETSDRLDEYNQWLGVVPDVLGMAGDREPPDRADLLAIQ